MTSGFPNMVFGWVVTSTLIPTNCRFVSLRYPTIKCTISFCCLLASYVLLSVTFFCVSPQPNTIIDKRKASETLSTTRHLDSAVPFADASRLAHVALARYKTNAKKLPWMRASREFVFALFCTACSSRRLSL